METTKIKLYQHCVDYVEQRIQNANNAMTEAQSSANSETKSTAGDKHDTARAMMQLAAEQNAKHLAEAKKLNQVIPLLNPKKITKTVQIGSLVIASNGRFYIAISVGKIEIEGERYFAISPTSPMGQLLKGLKKGEQTEFNGKSIQIIDVY